MSFVEQFWEEIRMGRIQNFPNPIPLNVNLAFTVLLPDQESHLVYLPHTMSGLCYRDHKQFVNVFPMYRGIILSDAELSHGTDLYKPKTEEDFVRTLYQKSWEIEQNIQAYQDVLGPYANAASYILDMLPFVEWMRYYNSTVKVGV